jgi:hypothetical protein
MKRILSIFSHLNTWQRVILQIFLLLVLLGANVVTFLLPSTAFAASSQSMVAHGPDPICPNGKNNPAKDHCFLPNALNCKDSDCYNCDTTKCTLDPEMKQIIADAFKLPIDQNNMLFLYTPPALTVDNPVVLALWKAMLGLVDLSIVVTIVLNGVRLMIVGSVFRRANAAQVIPSMLLALIAAHASLLLVTIFISFNNSMSTSAYSMMAKWISIPNSGSAVTCKKQDPDKIQAEKEAKTIKIEISGAPGNYEESQDRWIFPSMKSYHLARSGALLGLLPEDANNVKMRIYEDNPNWSEAEYQAYLKEYHGNPPKNPDPIIEAPDKPGVYAEFAGANKQLDPSKSFVIYRLPTDFTLACERWDAEAFTTLTSFPKISWTDEIKLLFGSILNLLQTIFKFSMLALMAQMVLRFFLLDLYIVLGPLGLACWALPGHTGQPLTRAWLRGFFSTVFVQSLQVLALLIGEGTLPMIDDQLQKIFPDSEKTLVWIVAVVLVWLIIRIPSILGTAPLMSMMDVGQKTSQAVSAVISHDLAMMQLIVGGATSLGAAAGMRGMMGGGGGGGGAALAEGRSGPTSPSSTTLAIGGRHTPSGSGGGTTITPGSNTTTPGSRITSPGSNTVLADGPSLTNTIPGGHIISEHGGNAPLQSGGSFIQPDPLPPTRLPGDPPEGML